MSAGTGPALDAAVQRPLSACVLSVGIAACGGADAPPAADGAIAASDARDPVGADAPTSGADYDHDGPVPYTTTTEQVVNGDHTIEVTVYMPSSPGPHPVVSFSCGSTQTAAGYVEYGKRLASHGIAMVLADDPGIFTNTADIVPDAVYVVETWLPAAHGGAVDLDRVGLGGHSRGGAVSLLAAEHGLYGQVDAWFGLDPVDNQFLMTPGEFARTDLASIGIPTGFLGAEVESNCAPAADSYPTLYPLAPPPKVLVVGIGAGHAQMENTTGCTGCGLCSPPGTADAAVVLAYSVRYFTAFFARELLGDTGVGARFEGAGGPADVAAGRVTIE
jgi:hypothetical protein